MSTEVLNKANEALVKIKADYEKNGVTEKTVAALREIRLYYRDVVVNPMLTKMCRLLADHFEAYGKFDLDISDEEEGDVIEGDTFVYLLEIMQDPDNKYNYDEIQAFKQLLIDARD
jgi:hypothetical protein